ncbi:carboxyl-terminal PDZ ligand of neuronal nitric oxide synthase protein isoform X3 [Ascaphus truei]
MFQNASAARTPKLQPCRSLTQLARPHQAGAGGSDTPGVGILLGSTQHLKNLGKAVGAKVNDFLRRKETDRGDIGVTEVNKTVAAVLSTSEGTLCGGLGEGDMSKFLESFPRLEPPPMVKKRTPRALKTTQDMMISPNPVISSQENHEGSHLSGSVMLKEAPSESATDQEIPPTPQQPDSLPNGRAETDIQEPIEDQKRDHSQAALSVPDLIHKEQLETHLRVASSDYSEKMDIKISISQNRDTNDSVWDLPLPRNCSLDKEGPHPDLLSFE